MARKHRTLTYHLAKIPDPRGMQGRCHLLIDILVIAVTGALCGAESWRQIEEVGRVNEAWFRTFLKLPNGIPSHDTFGQVFSVLDASKFGKCFIAWVQAIQPRLPNDVVPIDGKTLRRSFDTASGRKAIHVVSAWSCKSNLVLGQVAVGAKTNEITAIPELLKSLHLEGATVTIDAMGCQTAIAAQIVRQKAHYILALKGNHPHLLKAVEEHFRLAMQSSDPSASLKTTTQSENNRGRREVRTIFCTEDLSSIPIEERQRWPGLKTIILVLSERTVNGKTTPESRTYLSSHSAEPERLARAIRSHWSIENKLHWVLDVSLREDLNRCRKGVAAHAGAILRHIVLNLLRLDPDQNPEESIKSRQLRAAMDPNYRRQALLGFTA